MKTKALLAIVVFNFLLAATQLQAAYFHGIGDGFYSLGKSVSADGTVAVGHGSYTGFRWTPTGGMRWLGFVEYMLPSAAYAVSGDGGVVVGCVGVNVSGFTQAYHWTSTTGIETVPYLPGGWDSHALAVNHDGSAVVGGSTSTATAPEFQAFLWTPADGVIGLGTLEGHSGSTAYSISGDGSIVAGTSKNSSTGKQEAFRWTASNGMGGLGFLPDYDSSSAYDVSADGTTIVGTCSKAGVEEAFRWRKGTSKNPFIVSTMEGLGDLGYGALKSKAYGVSGDGEIVVGVGNSGSEDEAVIWIGNSLHRLKTYLGRLQLPVKGWTLTAASDISADGKTIVGYGINPDGEIEAWIANIDINRFPGPRPPGGFKIIP